MTAFIRGYAAWLPARAVGNEAWPQTFLDRAARFEGDRTLLEIPSDTSTDVGRLVDAHLKAEQHDPFISSVEGRWALSTDTARAAEAAAGRAACEHAGVDPRDIDVVLSAEIAPDRVCPSAGCHVAHALGATRAFAVGTDMGCAGGLAQWQLASALIASGAARHVLCTQSHLMTRVMTPEHPASPGLGDAATAQLLGTQGPYRILAQHAVTHGEFYDAICYTRGLTDAVDLPWWKGGAGDFHIGSRDLKKAHRLMKETVRFGAQTLRELYQKAGVDPERVSALFSVQPRYWIPPAIARCAGMEADAAHVTFDRYAHVGGCGPFLNWADYEAGRDLSESALLAFYAQGAGFTRAAALVEAAPSQRL